MSERVLIVDDDTNILASLKRNLRSHYDVTIAAAGTEAIDLIRSEEPFAVILSDYQMPEMDGIELLARCRQLSPDSVRIMLTGQADMRVAIQAVNQGYVFQFLTKPCPPDVLESALHAAVEHYLLVQSEKELLDKTLKGSVKLLIDILALVNPRAFSQASRYRTHMKDIAERLEFKDTWQAELTGLLSMIGCVTVPPDILRRQNSMERLSAEEMEVYHSHARIGSRLLDNIPRMETISQAIKYQNKRYDGSGPPADGVHGEDIPSLARLLKLVMDYDELTEAGMKGSGALNVMHSRQSWYDPLLLATLDAMIGRAEPEYIAMGVDLDGLQEGMIIAEDIKDRRGHVVVTAKTLVTPVLIAQLRNYSRMSGIVQPITVMVNRNLLHVQDETNETGETNDANDAQGLHAKGNAGGSGDPGDRS